MGNPPHFLGRSGLDCGFQLLDLTGPYEVFQHASPLSAEYDCQVVSRTPGPVRSGSGLPVHASHGVVELDPGGIDTLVVAGGSGVDLARADRALVDWVSAAGATSRRVTSVCSGVFLLAAAGLVTGRRVTPTGAGPASSLTSIRS
jgi:transcriptional regulator GlxA family with amidase domain